MIYAASGNCHVFVDARADLDARRGDRPQRQDPAPGRLQRGRDAARARRRGGGVPARACCGALRDAGVEVRGDERRARHRRGALAAATEEDWAEEFLALVLAVRGRGLGRGGDRARQPLRLGPLGGDRDRTTATRRGRSSSASTRPACTSTPRRASPTAASSGWAPRSATRRRSCTPAGRSALRELCAFKYLIEGDGQIRP